MNRVIVVILALMLVVACALGQVPIPDTTNVKKPDCASSCTIGRLTKCYSCCSDNCTDAVDVTNCQDWCDGNFSNTHIAAPDLVAL